MGGWPCMLYFLLVAMEDSETGHKVADISYPLSGAFALDKHCK